MANAVYYAGCTYPLHRVRIRHRTIFGGLNHDNRCQTDRTMDLIERYIGTRDPDAREQIVTNYLPLVRSIVRRFRNSRLPMAELKTVVHRASLLTCGVMLPRRLCPQRTRGFAALGVPGCSLLV